MWGREPLPQRVSRYEPGLALLWGGPAAGGPSPTSQLQPHLQLLVSVGGGGGNGGGTTWRCWLPAPSPGQRALGEKDLAKRTVGEREVLEGRTHTHEVCMNVCVRSCVWCVGE